MTYRVGEHYGIHVYEDDRPVATFVDADEAAAFVEAANRDLDDDVAERAPLTEPTTVGEMTLPIDVMLFVDVSRALDRVARRYGSRAYFDGALTAVVFKPEERTTPDEPE